jgi:hypothetical protein
MEVFFVTIILAIILDVCSARTYGSSGSSSSTSASVLGPAIAVPIAFTLIVVVIILIIYKKCCKRGRLGVVPIEGQMAFSQQGNQYAPPSYNPAPPYGQLPSYNQTPYSSAPNGLQDPTKMTTFS